jgi:hypothetical protein
MSAELFRYRGAAKDGGTLEYIFESDEQGVPRTATKEKVAEIAADFMETKEFRTTPVPYWLVCFSDAIKGPMRQMFFVVLLRSGSQKQPQTIDKRMEQAANQTTLTPIELREQESTNTHIAVPLERFPVPGRTFSRGRTTIWSELFTGSSRPWKSSS